MQWRRHRRLAAKQPFAHRPALAGLLQQPTLIAPRLRSFSLRSVVLWDRSLPSNPAATWAEICPPTNKGWE